MNEKLLLVLTQHLNGGMSLMPCDIKLWSEHRRRHFGEGEEGNNQGEFLLGGGILKLSLEKCVGVYQVDKN